MFPKKFAYVKINNTNVKLQLPTVNNISVINTDT